MKKNHSFRGKRVTVVGLARSGIAACRLLLAAGASVIGTEQKERRDLSPELADLERKGIELELGGHTERALKGTDLVVTSPGVPWESPFLKEAKERGIPTIGEVALAFSLS